MPSDRKKKKATAPKGKGPASKGAAKDDASGSGDENGVDDLAGATAGLALQDTGRSCTGISTSHPQSRDIHIESFTLLYHGHELLQDASLELNFGRSAGPRAGPGWEPPTPVWE